MKFEIGAEVKHKTSEFKMIVIAFNDENDYYKCRWYDPEKTNNEDGFISTNFHETELELFTKQ